MTLELVGEIKDGAEKEVEQWDEVKNPLLTAEIEDTWAGFETLPLTQLQMCYSIPLLTLYFNIEAYSNLDLDKKTNGAPTRDNTKQNQKSEANS
ncbi:hypothetical protein TWF751_009910 [Orbilia oligospora]|nr:hypothetical protein TWF751_009910 [Orbilia oligospora]